MNALGHTFQPGGEARRASSRRSAPLSPPGPHSPQPRPGPVRGRGGRAGLGWGGQPSLCCPAPCTGTWWAPRLSSTCRRRRASATWAKVSSSRTCCGPGRRRALPSSVPSPPAPSPSSCAPRRNKSAPRGVPSPHGGLFKCLTPRRRTAAACQRGLRRRTEAASSRRRPQVSAGPCPRGPGELRGEPRGRLRGRKLLGGERGALPGARRRLSPRHGAASADGGFKLGGPAHLRA